MGKTFYKPAGAVLLAIITAASYVFPIPTKILQDWGFLIFFAIFCIYIGWYIWSLSKKLESKPALAIRHMSTIMLTDPQRKSFPIMIEYVYGILIVNSSSENSLGIIDIRLELQYEHGNRYIPPYVGILESDLGNAIEGQIPSDMRLEPNDSRGGNLAFIDKVESNDQLKSRVWENAHVIIRDAQGNQHIFPANVEKMIIDNTFGNSKRKTVKK